MSVGQRKQRIRFEKAAAGPRKEYVRKQRQLRAAAARQAKQEERRKRRIEAAKRFSVRASLCALGRHIQKMRCFRMLYLTVKISQKTVEYSPVDKLVDCMIGMMAGIAGVVGVNTRVRTDVVLCLCFGRTGCAEASVIHDTLDACNGENVEQLQDVLKEQLAEHGECVRHFGRRGPLVLDVDLSGKRAGRKAEGSTKGYFAGRPNVRGRQLVRVYASQYDEIVCQWMMPGNTNSSVVLKEAVERAEKMLGLTEEQRKRTLIRADSGFGTDENINWLLWKGYEVLIKGYSSSRAGKLSRSVTQWEQTTQPGRYIGLPSRGHRYGRRTVQVVVRMEKESKKKKGEKEVSYHVLVSTLCDRSPEELIRLYDARSGHPESSFQQDSQGLRLTRRQKRRMEAQQMLVGLAQMAHNLLVWARRWAKEQAHATALGQCGILRWVRDALAIPGLVEVGKMGVRITLRASHPLSRGFVQAFSGIFGNSGTTLSLGEI